MKETYEWSHETMQSVVVKMIRDMFVAWPSYLEQDNKDKDQNALSFGFIELVSR